MAYASWFHWLRVHFQRNCPRRPLLRSVRKPGGALLRLEALEDRWLPSTLVVNTTQDVLGHANGVLSLRQAILDANSVPASGTPVAIAFNLPANDANHFDYKNDGIAGQVSRGNKVSTTAADDALIGDIDPDWAHSWWTIKPASALPALAVPVVIDGYSQPGASPNTLTRGDNAVLRIELDGSFLPVSDGSSSNFAVLTVAGGNSTVQGLTINGILGNNGTGMWLQIKGGNHVQGNFIGTDVSGTLAPNGRPDFSYLSHIASYGVHVSDGSQHNWVGTDGDGVNDPAERNVLSANYWGVILRGYGLVSTPAQYSGYNVVAGNFIGTDRTGTKSLGNWTGIGSLGRAHDDRIGTNGTDADVAGEGNVISGNKLGIMLGAGYYSASDASHDYLIAGNGIGVDVNGQPLGNVTGGVGSAIGFYSAQIGGPTAPLANTIAYNAGFGVGVTAIRANSYNIRVQGNSIHDNGNLGIDLGASYPQLGRDPVVLNDSMGHTGPNNWQNFPVLTAAYNAYNHAPGTMVQGTLHSTASAMFTIDFYANAVADPSGYGQGQTYLGATTVTTDGNGNATFTAMLAGVPDGQNQISATATDLAGNTSEFSRDLTAVRVIANPGGPYAMTFGGSVTLDASASSTSDGNELTYSWTIAGHANAASGVKPTLTWSQLQAAGVNAANTAYSVTVQVNDGPTIVSSSANYGPGQWWGMALIVNRATPTVSVVAPGGIHNGNAFAATATVTGVGGVPGASLEGVGLTLDYLRLNADGSIAADLGASAPTAAGSYKVVASFAGSPDYTAASASTTFTVAKAPLTVTADNASRMYGQPNPIFTGGITGVQTGDSIVITFSTSATASSPVGTYLIVPTLTDNGTGTLASYDVSSNCGMLTVTPATLSVNASDATKVYGQQNPTFTGTITGIQNGDSIEITFSTLATASSPVDLYPITPALSDHGTGALTNYMMNCTNGMLAITPATPAITVTDAGGTYNGLAFPATASLIGVNGTAGSSLEGSSPTLAYYAGANVSSMPLPGAPRTAGTYTVVASFPGSADYTRAGASTTFTITKASLTVAANNASKMYGQANPLLTGRVSGIQNGDPILVTYSTTATTTSPVGSYPIVPTVSDNGTGALINYSVATTNGTLTVIAAPLTAKGTPITAIAGAPFSGAVATFTDPNPLGNASSYTAVITWPDNSTSPGTVVANPNGGFIISGSYTFAAPGTYSVRVQVSRVLGATIQATAISPATVTSLGQGLQHGMTATIGFWQNKNGQALIQSFNGGPTATALAKWLATTFPNLYGAGAGANNLTGMTNAQVAAFYVKLFTGPAPKLDAQVLATALNLYATTLSLGGTAGRTYGFLVSATGLGAVSYNVGSSGAAFGVPNNTVLNVYQLLKAANQQAVRGVLYNSNAALRSQAVNVFNGINQTGDITG
jgi:hypothetical protein